MDPSYTHSGSRTNLLGANPSKELENLYSNEKQVADDNPPCFICYATNDNVVPIANSKNYYQALLAHNVPAYLKEYPSGGHGFGFTSGFAYHDDMLNELSNWLCGLKEYLHDDAGVVSEEWSDVTSTYISNPGFELCPAYSGNVMVTNAPSGNSVDYSATEWTLAQMSDWCCSAVMEYCTNNQFSTTTCTPPAADNAGNGGNALAISIGRTYQIRYQSSKELTLPAGHYRLRCWCINRNTDAETNTEFHSLLGFVPTDGEPFLSTLSGLTVNKWTTDEVEFTLTHETKGRVQVGGKGINYNKASTLHAKVFIDNLTLEYQPPFISLLDYAIDLPLPQANIGDGPFQRPAEPIERFKQAVQAADQAYDAFCRGEDVDLESVESQLAAAIEEYEAVKDAVNPPREGARYKLTSTFYWANFNASLSGLTGGVLTLGLHATQAVPGTYVLSLGPTSEERYENRDYLAQAFTFTPVEGVPGGFTMSITDEEGLVRYVCSGAQYSGGNSLQIRTTTDASKALTLCVSPADEEGVICLRNTACNINLSFRDYVAYCWSEMTNRSDGFLLEEVSEPLHIEAHLPKGSYMPCVFPFAVDEDGQSLSDIFENEGRVEVFSCFSLDETGDTLALIRTTALMANTPYILKAVDDFDLSISGYGTAIAPSYTSGWLVGNYAEDALVPVDSYIFTALDDGYYGFSRIDTETNTEERRLTPYTAFLQLPELADDVPSMLFLPSTKENDESFTGIKEIETVSNQEHKDTYDLTGSRIQNPTHGKIVLMRESDGRIRKVYINP